MTQQGIFEVATIASNQPSRTGWQATYRTEITDLGLRALGSMCRDGRLVREAFDVSIDDSGSFAVTTGGRGGLKVWFHHPMFEEA